MRIGEVADELGITSLLVGHSLGGAAALTAASRLEGHRGRRDQHRLIDAVSRLDAAPLLLHAPLDDTVSVDNARPLFEAARHRKSFVSLAHADHLLTNEGDARYAAKVVASRGDLDRETRDRLLTIADRCPVHRTLEGQIEIRTTEADRR